MEVVLRENAAAPTSRERNTATTRILSVVWVGRVSGRACVGLQWRIDLGLLMLTHLAAECARISSAYKFIHESRSIMHTNKKLTFVKPERFQHRIHSFPSIKIRIQNETTHTKSEIRHFHLLSAAAEAAAGGGAADAADAYSLFDQDSLFDRDLLIDRDHMSECVCENPGCS